MVQSSQGQGAGFYVCVYGLGVLSGCIFMFSISSVTEQSRKLSAEGPRIRSHPIHDQRKVFLDLGSNDGSSISYFLGHGEEGNVATQGGAAESPIKGMGKDGEWEVVAVEANFIHTPKLKALKDNVLTNKKVDKFHLFDSTAISTHDGNITFYMDTPGDGSAGATTVKESASIVGRNYHVRGISPVTLFRRLGVRRHDTIVLKIDIEGAEYDVLRNVLTSGLLPMIDVLAVEWHEKNWFVFGQNASLSAEKLAQHKCLDWVIKDSGVRSISWG